MTASPTRTTSLHTLLAALALGPCSGVFACEQPSLPRIPAADDIDDDVGRVIVAVQRYVVGAREYIDCVRAALNDAGGDAAPVSVRNTLIRRNNDAIAETETVLALFTERVGSRELLGFAELLTSPSLKCVSVRDLVSTNVVSDRMLVFRYRDGAAFLNVLERSCAAFARYDSFSYQANAGKLCSDDRVYPGVIETGTAGPGCDLGEFAPISAEHASRLLEVTRR